MSVAIRTRRDTAANWTSANPTLALGEQGYETDTNKLKFGDGVTAWNSLAYFDGGGVTDHGALTGLGDDDHTQYHNDARGDARYAPIAKGVTNGDSHDHAGGDGAQIDHGGLAGLTDDDHGQYHTDARGDARYAPIAAAVPAGGSTDQVLAKASASDYDLEWQDPAGLTNLDGGAPDSLYGGVTGIDGGTP